MWRAVWRRIWCHRFVILAILFFFLTVHYATAYYGQKAANDGQKQETVAYKAKYEAVSALFTPHATACPKPPKCPSQALPVQPLAPRSSTSEAGVAPRSAPITRRESVPKETVPDYRDALSQAAEAAEKAKAEALKDEPPPAQPAQINPAINRRDKNGHLKPTPSKVHVIRIPKWLDK